jgi:hypothetical protein
MWQITSKPQTIKRPPDNIEGTEAKKPRTAQTDGPGFSIAAESPMDETGHEFGDPSDHAPDNASLDVPRSPALRLQETLLEIPWELIQKCFGFPVPPVDPLIVESSETLQNSARPMATLAQLNEEMNGKIKAQYGPQLATLRWTHELTRREGHWLNHYGNSDSRLTKWNIEILVEKNAYQPTLPQAPSQHTLALMIAAQDDVVSLYKQLRSRVAAKKIKSAPHMDWDRLPVHVLVVAYLRYGRGATDFEHLTGTMKNLGVFSTETQAQVHADLFALWPADDTTFAECAQKLTALDTPASKAQLKRIEHLHHASKASTQGAADLTDVGPLLESFPPPGTPWNLSALLTMRLLSDLHKKNLLTPVQVQALVDQATAMLRYFMSLAAPGNPRHPLNDAAALLSNTLAAAFDQLSPEEKARLLKILPAQEASALIDRSGQDQSRQF